MWHLEHSLILFDSTHCLPFVSIFTDFNNSEKVETHVLIELSCFLFQMKMNVRQEIPAPTPATMRWEPITAPVPLASPSLPMEELVKVSTKLNAVDSAKHG